MITVLITSAGAGPAVSVIKALKSQREIQIRIVSVDMDPLATGLYLSDNCYIVPSANDPEFVDSILEICKKEHVNFIIPIFDIETPVFAKSHELFLKENIRVLVNDYEVIERSNDKLKAHYHCVDHDILVPHLYTREEIERGDYTLPIIIKPRYGIGTKGIQIVRRKGELDYITKNCDNFLFQEFIEGTEYTIDNLSDLEGNVLAVIPRERLVVKAGQTVKGVTVKDPGLIKWGRDVTRKFGIRGPGCSQCIVKDRKIYFIEMNPRYGTGVSLAIGAGVNIPLLHIKLVLKEEIKEHELDFRNNFYMLRYWEEVFTDGNSLQKAK